MWRRRAYAAMMSRNVMVIAIGDERIQTLKATL